MAFTKFNDIVAALGAGNVSKATYQKAGADSVAVSTSHGCELFTATGVPAATPLVDVAGVGTVMTGSAHNGIDIGSAVDPLVRHLIGGRCTALSVMSPTCAVLVDLLYTYQSCLVGASPTVLDNSAALTRYTDGVGVMAFGAVQTTLGATAPVMTPNVRFDDDSDANTPTLTMGSGAVVTSLWRQTTVTSTLFFPLNAGKRGIKRINSYTNTLPTTGTVWFGLCKPLAFFPLMALGGACGRDFIFQLPIMPRIYDGACLGWLLGGGVSGLAVNGTIIGSLNFAHG